MIVTNNPIFEVTSDTWPWPQVLFTENYVIVAALADWEAVNERTPSEVTTLVLFELYNLENVWYAEPCVDLGDPAKISHIEVMDFNLFCVVTVSGLDANGVTVQNLLRNPRVAQVSERYTKLPSVSCPNFLTGCNYNGQAIIGGIITDDASWGFSNLHSLLWSGIGKFEFRVSKDKTAGGCVVPWSDLGHGAVLSLKKLGKQVIAYGHGGKLALIPASEPVSTYVPSKLPGIGLLDANHLAGDDFIHGWIDSSGFWHTMTADLNETNHGFLEFLRPLVKGVSPVRVSYEPTNKRFYISNGIKSYVFQNGGLYSTHQMITSVGVYRGQFLCGLTQDLEDVEARIMCGPSDFQQRSNKTIETVEVHAYTQAQVLTKVESNAALGGISFRGSGWIKTNQRGISVNKVNGCEFNLGLKLSNFLGNVFNLDGLKLRIKFDDFRSIRGLVNADKTNS